MSFDNIFIKENNVLPQLIRQQNVKVICCYDVHKFIIITTGRMKGPNNNLFSFFCLLLPNLINCLLWNGRMCFYAVHYPILYH